MNTDQLLNQILPILYAVKDDEEKLQQILDFLLNEIYEEPNDEILIPEKYKELVRRTAESIDCGLVCFINPETLETEEVPKELMNDVVEFDEDEAESDNEFNLNHYKWERYITIEPPESHESFEIMESFVTEITNKNLKNRILNALGNRKPFANFKNLIETSNYREQWFAFKQRKLEEYVWEYLIGENFPLNQED